MTHSKFALLLHVTNPMVVSAHIRLIGVAHEQLQEAFGRPAILSREDEKERNFRNRPILLRYLLLRAGPGTKPAHARWRRQSLLRAGGQGSFYRRRRREGTRSGGDRAGAGRPESWSRQSQPASAR